MDPLTAAGAFATIIGLLSNFKAERSGADLSEFIAWLREKHHEEVANAISRNAALSAQLTSILATNHEELLKRLARLDALISAIASNIEGFSGLAQAINPEPSVSEQALSVLKQLVSSDARMFMEHKLSTGQPDEYILVDGAVGKIQYSDPRFIKDDLEALVQCNTYNFG